MNVLFEIYACTEVGLVREHNEDAYLVNNAVVVQGNMHIQSYTGNFILAVADGVGGLNAGEVASRLCLTGLSIATLPITNDDLESLIRKIDVEVFEYGQQNPETAGLGTTLAGILCVEDKVTTFHAGDSRVYRFRDGILKQLTVDDSLVQVLYTSGKITREDMFTSPDNNIILQVIGHKKQNRDIDPHIQEVRGVFEEEDIFLICSDGLTDMIPHDCIEDIISTHQAVPEMVRALIEEANSRGGLDNITIVAVKKPAGSVIQISTGGINT
jgi:protein phosphatase